MPAHHPPLTTHNDNPPHLLTSTPPHPHPKSPSHPLTLSPHLFFLLLLLTGCRHSQLPGVDPLPPGIVRQPGVFTDIAPRWSHNGRMIAFLRQYTDRSLQLCVGDAALIHISTV